jgi:hypothetical protein
MTGNFPAPPAKPYRRPLVLAVAIIIIPVMCIAMAQVGATIYFSQKEVSLKKADLAIVFPGESARVKSGFQMARNGLAENLMVINSTAAALRSKMSVEGVPEEVSALPGGVSRSTFEDAYMSAQAIRDHEFTSVILITSWYHLPRAYILLKWHLAGTGKTISIQCYPAQQSSAIGIAKKVELYYNETMKLWGSSAEMLAYTLTDRLPLDSLTARRLQSFIKTNFLFRV